jgi:hypothetical protein
MLLVVRAKAATKGIAQQKPVERNNIKGAF